MSIVVSQEARGNHRGFRPVLRLQFGKNVGHVMLHGLFLQVELLGDLFVAETAGDKLQNLTFPFGQRLERIGAGPALRQI